MSKFGSLVAGLGIGAAQAYMKRKNEADQDARTRAILSGQPVPKRERPIDALIGKVKSAFAPSEVKPGGTAALAAPASAASAAPAADNRPAFNVSMAEQAAANQTLAPASMPATDSIAEVKPMDVSLTDEGDTALANNSNSEPPVDTAAWNDDDAVSNTPTPFKNSYEATA